MPPQNPLEEKTENNQTIHAGAGSTLSNVSQSITTIINNHPWWFVGVITTCISTVILLIAILLTRPTPPHKPQVMDTDIRIAVAGFTTVGTNPNQVLGSSVAQSLATNIEQALDDLDFEFSYTVWGPDQVNSITGDESSSRAQQAHTIAEQVNATVVVYGVIDTTQSVWHVVPEFYLLGLSFTDATELDVTGEHQLGNSFDIPGFGDAGSQMRLTSELAERSKILAQLLIGLAFYATRDFERAYEEFAKLELADDWDESIGGQQLLYLLLGNTAGRNNNMDLAEEHYLKALDIDPEYSRAFAGLGNVYFSRALSTDDPNASLAETDLEMLEQSIHYYEQAQTAQHQPALSDIETKVHFGLGQAYYIYSHADENVMVAPAIPEFIAVIEAYNDGANPRLRELAAESYTRLGAIHNAGGDKESAVKFYQRAIELFEEIGNLERRDFIQEQLKNIQSS